MKFEINTVKDGGVWYIDLGATRHMCKGKSLFKTYTSADAQTILYMGKSSSVEVKDIRMIDLELTSEKVLILRDVYCVSELLMTQLYIHSYIMDCISFLFHKIVP